MPNLVSILSELSLKKGNDIYLHSSYGHFTYRRTLSIVRNISSAMKLFGADTVVLNFQSQERLFFVAWACLYRGNNVVLLPGVSSVEQVKSIKHEKKTECLFTDIDEVRAEALSLDVDAMLQACEEEGSDEENIIHARQTISFCSSGTTGTPKSIDLLASDFFLVVDEIRRRNLMPYTTKQTVLITPPLYHSYGLSAMLEYTAGGSAIVLPRESSFIGPVKELLNPELSSRITSVEGTAYFYRQLSQVIMRTKLSSLKHIGFGGDAIDEPALASLQKYYPMVTYSIRYGLTENPSVVSLNFIAYPYTSDWTSSGRVLPFYDVTIESEEGDLCEPGVAGEIVIRSNILSLGNAFENGYALRTGDVGFFDEHGELHISGRKSVFIKNKGFRINPVMVENLLRSMDGVVDCRILSLDNKLKAEIVSPTAIEIKSVIDYLGKHLPHYAIPVIFENVEAIKRTKTGKVIRS